MRRFPGSALLAGVIFMALTTAVLAADESFTYTSNWGGTGLMEVPTARILRGNSYRLGVGQVNPYRYYYGAISPLPDLEIDGRITEILNVPGFRNSSSYGNYKDKAVDVKYRFVPEGKYIPALAFGVMDPNGTRIYSSQYIVAGKQIYPFDFTVGLGNGRFGKKPLPPQTGGFGLELLSDPKSWLSDSAFFWGVQLAPSERWVLMLEYNPIRYDLQTPDPAQPKYFREPTNSKFNIGLRWKPLPWTDMDFTFQRGDRVGINFSMDFDIGKPLIPIYDHPYRERPADRPALLSDRITSALVYHGFSDIGIRIEGDALLIEVQNNDYFYTPKAIGIIVRAIAGLRPEGVNETRIILKNNGIPIVEFKARMDSINDLTEEKVSSSDFLSMSHIRTDIKDTILSDLRFNKTYDYGVKPSVETFLNDPSGFFKYRIGAYAWLNMYSWKGGTFAAALAAYPVNNISSINKPSQDPVRTDIVLYKKESISLSRLLYDQVWKSENDVYLQLSTGLLEIQYAGLDGEIALPLLNGRCLLGIGGSSVIKRAPDSPFGFKENGVGDVYNTFFLNARLNIPEKEVAVDIKAGRFLAGDKGARVTVSKFIRGVVVSAWYSATGTSMFRDSFNRGYNDKGIAVSFPLRLFTGRDSKTSFGYALSPWTRDVAQDIDHYNPLFDFIGRDVGLYIEKDAKEMF